MESPHNHDHDGSHHDGSHHDGSHHGRGPLGWIGALLRPHSHDPADSIDSALEASADGMRALKLSLVGLLLTAALQVAVVVVSGSVALLADTVHNFADALTALPLGVAFWIGRKPPTRRYTYGYGRAEDLAGLFILAMIATSAVVAAVTAIDRLIHPKDLSNVMWVAVAGLVGFVGNETVALYRIRVGRRIGSAALVADGYHARTDALTSLAVVAGAGGVALGWPLADPIVGLLITVAILIVLKGAARDIYRRLMDSVEPALVDQIASVVAAVPGVERVDSVRVRWLGHELRAEVEIVSDARITLEVAHDIAEEAYHRLLHDVPRLTSAIIHTSPQGDRPDYHSRTAPHAAHTGSSQPQSALAE